MDGINVRQNLVSGQEWLDQYGKWVQWYDNPELTTAERPEDLWTSLELLEAARLILENKKKNNEEDDLK